MNIQSGDSDTLSDLPEHLSERTRVLQDAPISQEGTSSSATRKRLKLKLEDSKSGQLISNTPIGIHKPYIFNQSMAVQRNKAIALRSYDGMKKMQAASMNPSSKKSIVPTTLVTNDIKASR